MADADKKDLGRHHFNFKISGWVGLIVDCDHHIENLDKWAADESVDTPMTLVPASSKIVSEPLGVALVLGPWNFPYACTIGPAIAAIAAGNTVIMKPSEGSPNSMAAM